MLKYGFFDSYSGDRTYNAEDMNQMFEGIITDGVFAYVGDKLMTVADQQENSWGVSVGTGRAHFNGIWLKNDSSIYFPIDVNTSPSSDRNDYILLIVDKRTSGRECKIIYQKNTNSYGNGAADLYVYVLAKIVVPRNSGTVTNANITNYINNDQAETPIPWVTAPLDSIDISDLIDEWTEDIDAQIDAAIDNYFDGLTVATKPEDLGGGIEVCSTAAGVTTKTATIQGYKLIHGGRFSIRFNNDVPSGATLNVSSTGTKPLYHKNAPIIAGAIKAGNLVTFVYDSTTGTTYPNGRYHVAAIDASGSVTPAAIVSATGDMTEQQAADTRENISAGTYSKPDGGITIYDLAQDVQQSIHRADTAIQPQSDMKNLGGGIAQSTTAGGTVPKTATLSGYKLTVNSFVAVKFSTPVEASATLNINSTGAKPIFYRGAAITAGVITYGDTALFVYDGTNYNLVASDSATDLSGVVPRNQQAQKTNADTVEVKIDANGKLWVQPGGSTPSGDENTTIITMTYYDGDSYTSMTAAEIYNTLQDEEKNFVLIDRAGRQCVLIAPPESSSGTAKFATYDDTGATIVVYTITANGIATSTSIPVDISGLYTKPAGGIPKTDLSQAVQAGLEEVFPITVSVNGSTVTVDRTIAQIYAAVSSGKSCPVVVDGNYCGWVGYADQGECALYYINAHDSAPRLDMVYMDGTDVLLSDRELEMSPTEITLSGTTQTIIAWDNAIYKCGELTSLTISSAVGTSIIRFTSGTTPTALTIPQTLHMPDGFSVEANTRYEISVSDGYAVVGSWAVN